MHRLLATSSECLYLVCLEAQQNTTYYRPYEAPLGVTSTNKARVLGPASCHSGEFIASVISAPSTALAMASDCLPYADSQGLTLIHLSAQRRQAVSVGQGVCSGVIWRVCRRCQGLSGVTYGVFCVRNGSG